MLLQFLNYQIENENSITGGAIIVEDQVIL